MQIHVVDSSFGIVEVRFVTILVVLKEVVVVLVIRLSIFDFTNLRKSVNVPKRYENEPRTTQKQS